MKRHKRGFIFLAVVVLSFFAIFFYRKQRMNSTTVLKVGIRHTWEGLVPNVVATVYGDLVLRNIFEPLVQTNRDGTIVPLAASKWSVSPDFKEYTFAIDSKRKFSDGTPLEARHFKETWERTLRDLKLASGLTDIMQDIVGFDDFARTGSLPGIIAADPHTLVMKFRRSFRTAAEFLSSVRYAPFIQRNDKYLGTGAYVAQTSAKDRLVLEANPFRSVEIGFPSVELSVVQEERAHDALLASQIDVFLFSILKGLFSECSASSSDFECVYSAEMDHSMFALNESDTSIFHEQKMRAAFASLLVSSFDDVEMRKEISSLPKRYDLQFLAPLQKGRLTEAEAHSIVANSGKAYIGELIKASEKKPLTFVSITPSAALLNYLTKQGLKLAPTIVPTSLQERRKYLNGELHGDIIERAATVYGGDPDGLIHLLGKNARIRPKISGSGEVFDLLESGREILDPQSIDKHYQALSRALLRDLPELHFVFGYAVDVYRKNKVAVNEADAKWESVPLHLFRPAK